MFSNSRVHVCLFLAMGLVLSASGLAQNEWNTFQANASHDGLVSARIDPTKIKASWSVSLDSTPLYHASAGGSRIYVKNDFKKTWALDASTGQVLWRKEFSAMGRTSTPAYSNSKVYMVTDDNSNDFIHCFDADSGEELFKKAMVTPGGSSLMPTVRDGVVYTHGGRFGGMYAFDAQTGKELWFIQFASQDGWTPAVDATNAYAFVDGRLKVVNRRTGVLSYEIAGPNIFGARFPWFFAPVLGNLDDVLIVHRGQLIRYDLTRRAVSYAITGGFSRQPAVRNGVVYALSNGKLQARSQVDGRLLWTLNPAGQSLAWDVILTDGHALVRSTTHTFLVDLMTHKVSWSVAKSGSECISQGAIFIGEADGTLNCFRFEDMPEPMGVTPSRQHYAHAMTPVTIKGRAFSGHGQPEVLFGSKPASQVVLVDDQTITCVPPASTRAIVSVTVANKLGRRELDAGFVYYPAQVVKGEPRIGNRLEVKYECMRGDHVLCLVGVPMTPASLPPFTGSIELGLVFPLMSVANSIGTRVSVHLLIPSDPSLRGRKVGFQGLAGLLGAGGQGWDVAFTNMTAVEIR